MSDAYAIVPYDPEWPQAFVAERDRIAAALGDLAIRIDHYGSTSVPGLAARAVIDIQVSVRVLHPTAPYAAPLQQLGYTHEPLADAARGVFFHKPHVRPYTHQVRVVQSGGAEERRTLAFRDYLRDHLDVARTYEELRRAFAFQADEADVLSRRSSADAITAFVAHMTERALTRGYPLQP